jgi:predicted phage terminase large subunit-like protein
MSSMQNIQMTTNKIDLEKETMVAELQGSLLEFCKVFYPLLTGREFIISTPPGREPHAVTISRALTRAARLQLKSQRLIVNVPPGHGKSTFLCMWVAWTLSKYPDSRYLYISYSKSLAAKHTETIKRIIGLRHYKYLFDVSIRWDSKAKEFFQTTAGGSVAAFGSAGAIVGQDGGLPGLDRFSGAVIVDDPHKVDEAHSDAVRRGVIENYRETIQQRARGINVPYIYIGQRVHEDDLGAYLLNGNDGYEWEKVVLKSIDDAGNPLYPEAFPLESLLIKQEKDPYVFASQFQQNPIPAGGGLFKPDWFPILDHEPEMLYTFLTCDTAETMKSYNDASVFSFWGLYEIENFGKKTGELGLHWIDCLEVRVEPKDLRDTFISFYVDCSRHKKPPLLAAIEKKSTGVTLISVLKELRGLTIREVERTRASGSKTQRFLEMQPYIASKYVSFTKDSPHLEMCLKHMSSITANEAHRFDDIADTLADAVRLALIDKSVYSIDKVDSTRSAILDKLNRTFGDRLKAGNAKYDRGIKEIR